MCPKADLICLHNKRALIRSSIAQTLQAAIASLQAEGLLPAGLPLAEVQEPKNPEHGDFATSFALQSAKAAGKNPRELADLVCKKIIEWPEIEKAEAAGPGFINLTLSQSWVIRQLEPVLASAGTDPLSESRHYARPPQPKPLGINVEFVSVNPNGPITIGSGRGAAFGSALCNVLAAAGHRVHREYYINDGVNSEQMRLFALSVRSYVLDLPFPEKGYKGDYVQDVAARLKAEGVLPESEDINAWQRASQEIMLAKQKEDLAAFGTLFDTWFSEQSIHDNGMVQSCLDELVAKGVADSDPYRTKIVRTKNPESGRMVESVEKEDQPADEDDAEGAGKTVWLRSTLFGDDQDRVLKRKDGRLTYIASDVAYHNDKFNRPSDADKLITVLGPDHHGYIGRLRAVVAALLDQGQNHAEALETAKEKLEVVIFQLVRFVKDGKPAPMRKRDGNIYAVIDLIKEIGEKVKPLGTDAEKLQAGTDVARFFYLMRSHETTFDFDLDLAQRQSDDNPVFYVQYAHARICSVIAKGAEAGLRPVARPELLVEQREKVLALKVLDLPYEISRTSEDYSVHRLATYAVELARTYHHFYDVCRVVKPEEVELSQARLALCEAARIAIASVLQILGVSAPERMERQEAETEE